MDRKREIRQEEIQAAVSDVREIEKRDGVTRESLEKIKQRLIRLAARKDLFSPSDFPPPAPGGKLKSCDRAAEGPPRQKGEYVVKQGTGVCFLPEDLHSIHIQAPLVNFHMYGLALDHLHKREYYQAADQAWRVFPAHGDIREAR
jgi:hypothetical protein